ncbi:Multiple organellar RNA editing factor 8 chloroplastic/mitochondrial [Bienertia sinuspersici]
MSNYSRRRLLLSFRQPLHFYHEFKSSISRSISNSTHFINPNFRSSPVRSTSVLAKLLTPFNSSQLIQNLRFVNSLNGARSFATRLSESSSNRPPKDTIMLEGCDFEHWLVVVEPPDPELTRDDIIDGYIKTFAQIVGSEEEARMKIYSVSTRHYFAFSAVMSEELSYKLKELPNVRWVLPDSYMDVKNKTYAGEPFINGQAVPYDPKYHEIWVRNNEESLRNNNKGRRRQRDPNSRSRSSVSAPAHSQSDQNWMSASVPQPNQIPQRSSSQNQSYQPSSFSDPVAHSSRTQNPSRMQNHAHSQAHPTFSQNQAHPTFNQNQANPTFNQNQAHPTFNQNQAPHSSHMQNHSMPRTSPQPPVTIPSPQGWGSHNHNFEPQRGYENQTRHPSHMQDQTPSHSPTSNPYDPPRYVQNKSWEATPTYQSQPPPHSVSNNFQHSNTPPSAPSNVPYQGQSWVQSQPPQPPISNNYSHANFPPSAPARGMPTHMQNTNFHGGSIPPEAQQDGYYYRDMPNHAQSGGFSNAPSHSLPQQQYQDRSSAYRDMQSSYFVETPNAQRFPNSSDIPVDVQLNNYSRNVTYHAQNTGAQSGYSSEPPHPSQCQQYHNNTRRLQNSNATASPQDWNYQNMNPSMQNSISPNMPTSHGVQSHHFQGKDMPGPCRIVNISTWDQLLKMLITMEQKCLMMQTWRSFSQGITRSVIFLLMIICMHQKDEEILVHM